MTPTAERIVLGSLMACWPPRLPNHCARMLRHAPDSFCDSALGRLARVLLDVSGRDGVIHPHALQKRLGDGMETRRLLADLEGAALPLTLAELEAETLWATYRTRRTKQVLAEASAALVSAPNQVRAISATVHDALNSLNHDGQSCGLTVRTPDELMGMQFAVDDNLLADRLLAVGQALVIAGAGAIGKSRLLLQLSVCHITGRPWVGLETHGAGKKWLILQAENSNRRLQRDMQGLRELAGPNWPVVNALLRIHTLETAEDSILNLDDPAVQERILAAIAEHEPDIIGWDSLYNFSIGDLNKDQDMRDSLMVLTRLSRQGKPDRANVVLHHAITGRAGAAKATGYDRSSFGRNSKVLHSWTRGQVNVSPGSPDNNDQLVISCAKCSNGREFDAFAVRLTDRMTYEIDHDFDMVAWETEMTGRKPDKAERHTRIAELCKYPSKKAELVPLVAAEFGVSNQHAYKLIDMAHRAKFLALSKATDCYIATNK